MTGVDHTCQDDSLDDVEGVQGLGVHDLNVLLAAKDEVPLTHVVDCLQDQLEYHEDDDHPLELEADRASNLRD